MSIQSTLKKPKALLIIILLLASILRLYNLWYPNTYVFDEVYHGFTAKEYIQNHKEAWEWWTTPPPGVAYEWTHPPLAKEIMAVSMGLLRSMDPWAYRLPGALLGILSVYLVYLLGRKIFNSEKVGLISAFAFSLDGLNFVQSRTGMNDIYFVTFMLACILFFLHKRFFISAIFLGLAIASKWTGFYLFGLIMILATIGRIRLKDLAWFYLVPPLIYLLSYAPFFLYNHNYGVNQTNWDLFVELQKQMWLYHTNLKATHDYTSPWWSWPLNLKPVWYFVDYNQNQQISNIFASGNPLLFLFGFISVIVSIVGIIRKRTRELLIPVLGYLTFILPWALSPRIMFLYHYAPSVPFMALLFGYQLNKLAEDWDGSKLLGNKISSLQVLSTGIILILISFLFVYPMLVGIPLDRQSMLFFFRTNLTKNPFGWDP